MPARRRRTCANWRRSSPSRKPTGTRPAVPPRTTEPSRTARMPFVDRIIQYMQSQAGERIVLVNDQESLLYRAGGASEPVPQRLSLAQISSMLTEIMTEENRARYAAGDTFSFPYQHASGPVGIEVRQESGTVHVSLGPLEPASGDGAAARPS